MCDTPAVLARVFSRPRLARRGPRWTSSTDGEIDPCHERPKTRCPTDHRGGHEDPKILPKSSSNPRHYEEGRQANHSRNQHDDCQQDGSSLCLRLPALESVGAALPL